jgi:hypothetical protein
MFDRLLYDLHLLVNFFHKVHQFFNLAIVPNGIFQKSDTLEVAHAVHEGLALHVRINSQLDLVGKFIEAVLVGEGEGGGPIELSLEGDVEVDQFVFEKIGQRLGIGDDALDKGLVVVQLNLTDDGREGVGEKLDDFFSRIFSVCNENVVSFTLLGTADNQRLRAVISDADGVHSRVLVIERHHLHHFLCVGNASVCQKKDLFRIAFNRFLSYEVEERIVDFSASQVGIHLADSLSS